MNISDIPPHVPESVTIDVDNLLDRLKVFDQVENITAVNIGEAVGQTFNSDISGRTVNNPSWDGELVQVGQNNPTSSVKAYLCGR